MPQTTWIFFSSPGTVHSLLPKHSLANYQLACLGVGTAKTLEELGYKADFVGNGTPLDSAQRFSSLYPKSTVFLPHSDKSLGNVLAILEVQRVVAKVTYRTSHKQVKLASMPDLIAFTSPSNVHALALKNNLNGVRLFAIGESTASALRQYYPNKMIYVAKHSSEEGLTQIIKDVVINSFN